ncbi:hypothetical protein [Phenylobacterium sp.]|jgi:hypothetical protein|uniref:hypothetical protein n=1 Tax=Phenylobacterium sp. TaxID=1871053 RepID=UPI002F94FF9E
MNSKIPAARVALRSMAVLAAITTGTVAMGAAMNAIAQQTAPARSKADEVAEAAIAAATGSGSAAARADAVVQAIMANLPEDPVQANQILGQVTAILTQRGYTQNMTALRNGLAAAQETVVTRAIVAVAQQSAGQGDGAVASAVAAVVQASGAPAAVVSRAVATASTSMPPTVANVVTASATGALPTGSTTTASTATTAPAIVVPTVTTTIPDYRPQ